MLAAMQRSNAAYMAHMCECDYCACRCDELISGKRITVQLVYGRITSLALHVWWCSLVQLERIAMRLSFVKDVWWWCVMQLMLACYRCAT
jgi:hypothetical protein